MISKLRSKVPVLQIFYKLFQQRQGEPIKFCVRHKPLAISWLYFVKKYCNGCKNLIFLFIQYLVV